MLFGDSEVTFRLPMVLLGTAAIFLPYFLRRELGNYGAIAAALMLAFGPAFFYMSRFGHNEAMLVFQTILTVVGIFGWIRTRKPVYLYIAVIGFSMMFTTKVVSYLIGFMVVAFFGAALLIERVRPFDVSVSSAIRDIGWRRVGISAAIFVGMAVTLYTTFFTNLDGLCTMVWAPPVGDCAGKQGMLQYWLTQQGVARGGQPWFYFFMLIPLYETIPLVLALVAPFTARRPRSLFFWFCAWWAVFTVLIYTYAGEKMPWLTVHLAMPLVFLGALGIDQPLSRLRRPWGLLPRQWAVAGLALVGIAVLVALLTVGGQDASSGIAAQASKLHQLALALVVIAIFAGAWQVARLLTRAQAVGAAATAIMAVLVVYAIHTGWQVVYKNGDTPVEMLVYVQSSPDVPFIANEIQQIGDQLGLRKDVPILLDNGYTDSVNGQDVVHESVSWPFEWYFRNYTSKQYFTRTLPSDFASGRYAALLVMDTNLDPIRDELSGYTGTKFRLNWWYPEDYKHMTWGDIPWTLTDPVQRLKLLQYIVYRKLMNEDKGEGLGARQMWLYVRNDLVGATGPANGQAGPISPNISAPVAVVPPVAAQETVTVSGLYGQGVLKDPKGIAVDRAGDVYVVDGTNSNVTVFNPDGTVRSQWGQKGTGDGQFTEPWGIAVAPDGSVFVADTWNHRVQKFSGDGRFLLSWGSTTIGSGPSAFYGPRDIAITPSGQLLVTDTGNKRVQVFDQNGTFIKAFGTEGSAAGQFREPVGIAIDGQGRIYVADTWNQRIQVFSPDFQPLAQFPVQGWSSQSLVNKPYLATGADGSVYATVPERGSVLRLKDGIFSALSLPTTPKLGQPIGTAVDAQGRLLVSDQQGADVVAYTIGSEAASPASQPAAGGQASDTGSEGE